MPAGDPAARPTALAHHPQAMVLVQQQLELLASSTFRWNGTAWPGTAMAWEIQESQDEAAEADAQTSRRWTTTLTLTLPTLGDMEIRLSLQGPTVQARLTAEPASVAPLQASQRALALRFEASGLALQDLHISPMEKP